MVDVKESWRTSCSLQGLDCMNGDRVSTVTIAGAGIAGLATGIAFRKAGYDTVIVERTQTLADVGAGVLIQANGLLVLDALGLGNEVRSAGVPLKSFRLHDRHGQRLLQTEFTAVLPAHLLPVSIHRAELHRILYDACVSCGVSVRLGHQVTRVDASERQGTALVCDAAAGPQRVFGDLIVGADGVSSLVRETGGFEFTRHTVVEGSIQGVADFAVAPEHHGEYFGGGEACGMLPLGDARTFWFWGASGDAVERLDGVSFQFWKARVRDRFPAIGQVLGRRHDWSGTVRLLHRSIRCTSWSRGSVVLVGDAAHAMSPNLGQGANCALVDALCLASHVATTRTAGNPGAALTRFERERRPVVETLQHRGHQGGIVGTSNWVGADLAFKAMLLLARFAPWASRTAELRMMSGLRGEGFDLAAAGIHAPVPWSTAPHSPIV